MGEIVKSVLMGLGCLSILSFVGCGMMGAGVIVAADRAAERNREPRRASGQWRKIALGQISSAGSAIDSISCDAATVRSA
jgi:hypothetical protein